MNKDDVKFFALMAAALVLILGLVAGGYYADRHLPCSFYSGSSMKDVPARCWSTYNK